MEKAQSPAQHVAQTVPLQISPEQLQQLQQLQMQHGAHFAAIQVKQEFPSHGPHAQLNTTGSQPEIKHTTTGLLDPAQAQLQQMQMHITDGTAAATSGNPAAQQTPSSAAAAVMQQHSATTISAMPPMQLATTGPNDWTQGRTTAVQLMQQPTALNSGFLYHPSMLVSGNLIHPNGLSQQPIQVITAGKPFQGSTSQMITQNTKQLIGGNSSFSNGTYAIPSSQSGQTLLFSPVNVISQTPQQQQQNILQSMAAAAAQQQQQHQQQQNSKVQQGASDASKSLQQKLVQKVTTNTLQASTAVPSANASAQQQHQQQQQTTQQCVQMSQATMPTAAQVISPLQGSANPHQMQISAPWLQTVPFSMPWSNGLQQLTQNQIIIRGTQSSDGTQGMFIQQPSGHQTLHAQQPNQITLQCNLSQSHNKSRQQIDSLVPKVQQTQQQTNQVQLQTQQQQAVAQQQANAAAVVNVQLQQHQQQTATITQRANTQILPQNATQIRPGSSVSTQTAQNQNIMKQKMRNKQQPVRPALPVLKADNQLQSKPQTSQQQQQLSATVTQQQSLQPATMHQVVTSVGNKMVVMAGTPITIQNGQTIQQAALTADKQQQQQQQQQQHQQQLQLQQIQKQQVLQQMLQQQINQYQLQQQQQLHQQQQTQLHLQVSPQSFIAHQHQQQQQQQQHQNQQQQQQTGGQQQQALIQAQREPSQQQNIIHQIVVQHPAQQQQPPQQQQIASFTTTSGSTSATGTGILQQQQQQQQAQMFQQARSIPTNIPTSSSIVTIQSNQNGIGGTGTILAMNQLQPQQSQMNTIATNQQQQHQQQQQTSQSALHNSTNILATTNPILAMASMMNAATSVNINQNTTSTTPTATGISSMDTNNANFIINNSTMPPLTTTTTSITTTTTNTPALATPTTTTTTTTKVNLINDQKSFQMSSTLNSSCSSSNVITVTTPEISSVTSTSPSNIKSAVKDTNLNSNILQDLTKTANPSTNVIITQQHQKLDMINEEKTLNSSIDEQRESNARTPLALLSTISTTTTLNNSSFAVTGTTTIATTTPTTAIIESTNNVSSNKIVNQESDEYNASGNDVEKSSSISTNSSRLADDNNSLGLLTNSTFTKSVTNISCIVGKQNASTHTVKAERDLPKAMIKPNVLTHVIDGFIIQEANEPFPVTRQRYAEKDTHDEPPKKKSVLEDNNIVANNDNSNNNNHGNNGGALRLDMIACEQCGKSEHKSKMKKKRYCSLACARQSKVSLDEQNSDEGTDRVNNDKENNRNDGYQAVIISEVSNISNAESVQNVGSDKLVTDVQQQQQQYQHQQLVAPIMAQPSHSQAVENASTGQEAQPQIANWTVEDVCEFIKNLPGCCDYVDDFEQQEIDGQALLLLKENHLVNAMGMKLGPALKIVAKVEAMREINLAANQSGIMPNEKDT